MVYFAMVLLALVVVSWLPLSVRLNIDDSIIQDNSGLGTELFACADCSGNSDDRTVSISGSMFASNSQSAFVACSLGVCQH